MVGNSMVMPFLPLYVKGFGVGEVGAGLLFTSHAAARTVLLPLVGRASDRRGRKWFLVVGFAMYVLAGLAYSRAGTLLGFVLTALLHGTATAVVHSVAMAYAGDLAAPGEEGFYSGYINTAFLGGVASGPLLGGLASRGAGGLGVNFLWLKVLSLCSLLLVLAFLPEAKAPRGVVRGPRSSLIGILSAGPIGAAALFRLGYALSGALVWVFLPLLSAQIWDLDASQIGILVSANIMTSAALQAPGGRLADRTNKARLMALGGLVGALGLGALPLAGGFWHLLLLNVVVGGAYGIAFPAHTALAMENARGHGMGAVMSLLLMAHSAGMMVGPVAFGLLARRVTLGGSFQTGGLVGLVVAGGCYVLAHAEAKKRPREVRAAAAGRRVE
jgi:MFS family permease